MVRFTYMNTKTIVIALIAIAALGGVWYLFSNFQGEPTGGATPVMPVATTTVPTVTTVKSTPTAKVAKPVLKNAATLKSVVPARVTGIGPVAYLFGLKQPLVCKVTTTTGYSRTGTMYIAGDQMRANFTNASMIDDGTYLYVWTIGATKGLKLLAASSASGSAIATNGGFDLATMLSYTCNSWTEDASVFTPPTSVVFSNSL